MLNVIKSDDIFYLGWGGGAGLYLFLKSYFNHSFWESNCAILSEYYKKKLYYVCIKKCKVNTFFLCNLSENSSSLCMRFRETSRCRTENIYIKHKQKVTNIKFIQGYPKRMRLQKRQYGIYISYSLYWLCFKTLNLLFSLQYKPSNDFLDRLYGFILYTCG